MKGARGLLISITGGKDLTLFEVDEAATRIREEVDPDANIIVGATFDETLDGIIRVSVVATGIEQAAIAKAAAPAAAPATSAVATPDNRLADVTAKLRADNQRAVAATAQKSDAPRPAQAAPVAARAPANSIERAALAAIAAAVAPESMQPVAPVSMQPASYGDVTVRPIAQKPSLFPDLDVKKLEAQEPATPEAFIPQAAERTAVRAPRMPKFEDLPMPAQNEIRQARGETEEEQHPQKVQDVAAAAPRQCRPRPPRRGNRAADRGPRLQIRRWRRCRRCRNASRSAASPSKWRPTSRYRNMQGGPRRKD